MMPFRIRLFLGLPVGLRVLGGIKASSLSLSSSPNHYSTAGTTMVLENLCAKIRVRFPTNFFMNHESPHKISTTDHEFWELY